MGLTRSDYCIQEIGKDWVITLEANRVWGGGDEQEGKKGISVMQNWEIFSISALPPIVRQLPEGSEGDCWAANMEVPQGTADFPHDRPIKEKRMNSGSSWRWRWDEGMRPAFFNLRLPETSLCSGYFWVAT